MNTTENFDEFNPIPESDKKKSGAGKIIVGIVVVALVLGGLYVKFATKPSSPKYGIEVKVLYEYYTALSENKSTDEFVEGEGFNTNEGKFSFKLFPFYSENVIATNGIDGYRKVVFDIVINDNISEVKEAYFIKNKNKVKISYIRTIYSGKLYK